jgi:hypothetical protein
MEQLPPSLFHVLVVSYGPTGGTSSTKEVGAGVTSTTLTGLTAETQYIVIVAARNAVGTSAASLPGSTWTKAHDPAAPGNVDVEVISATSVKVSWDDTTFDETGFEIEGKGWPVDASLRDDNFRLYGHDEIIGTTRRSTIVSGLQPDTSYSFRVVAERVGRYRKVSAADAATTATTHDIAPGLEAPENVEVSNTNYFAWDVNFTGDFPTGTYFAMRAFSPGRPDINTAYANMGQLTPASPGVYHWSSMISMQFGFIEGPEYQVEIIASADSSFDTSVISDHVSVEVYNADAEDQVPTPHGLQASWTSSTTIDLSWDAVEEADSYIVIVPPLYSWEPAETNSLTVSVPEGFYGNFGVMASRSSTSGTETSFTSLPVEIEPFGEEEDPPAAPTDLWAHPSDDGTKVDLGWQNVSNNETGFRVERTLGPATTSSVWEGRGTTDPDETTFTDTTAGLTRYTYRVVAINAGGSSASTDTVVDTGGLNLVLDGLQEEKAGSPNEHDLGAFVRMNGDDDNVNDIIDSQETGTVNDEDDLIPLDMAVPATSESGDVVLTWSNRVRIWTTDEKGERLFDTLIVNGEELEVVGQKTWTAGHQPSRVWVEAIDGGMGDSDFTVDLTFEPIQLAQADPPIPVRQDQVRGNAAFVEIDPAGRIWSSTGNVYTPAEASGVLNSIVNPSGLVPMTSGQANSTNVSTIRITRSEGVNLTENDQRVRWIIKGSAQFYQPHGLPLDNTGASVRVFATGEGVITIIPQIETAKGWVDLDFYEAIGVKERVIRFRAQLLTGVSPTEAAQQIAFANSYLRQIGVSLQPGTDQTVDEGAHAVPKMPGFFRNTVPSHISLQEMDYASGNSVISLNERSEVLQLVYVESIGMSGEESRGLTVAAPGSAAASIEYSYRIDVGEKVKSYTMNLFQGRNGGSGPGNWGILIADRTVDNRGIFGYGQTIAHEVGHFLGFKHRDLPGIPGAGYDGLDKADDVNLMDVGLTPNGDTDIVVANARYDLDLIQCKAVSRE